MRPRGRFSSASTTRETRNSKREKEKTCFVRLEKMIQGKNKEQSETVDTRNKKLTGPIKKRPVTMKRTYNKRKVGQLVKEDLSSYNLVTARTKRVSKPNPKYSNDEVFTAFTREKEESDSYEDEDINEQNKRKRREDDESVEEEEITGLDDSSEPAEEYDDDFDYEHDSFLSDETKFKQKQKAPKSIIIARDIHTTVDKPRARGRPARVQKLAEAEKTSEQQQTSQGRKPVVGRENVKELESSIIARNRRLNAELYDKNDSDTNSNVTITKKILRSSKDPQLAIVSAIGKRKSSSPSIIQSSKRKLSSPQQLQVSIRNTSEKNNEILNKEEPRLKRAKQQIQIAKEDIEVPTTIMNNKIASRNAGKNNSEDFETMPTFTIVNINDIINKKDDVLIKKADNASEKNNSILKSSSRQDLTTPRNRRKTMHTILSEKIDHSSIPPKSPFPPRQQSSTVQQYYNNNNTLLKSSISLKQQHQRSQNSRSLISQKPMPRILNSIVSRKAEPVSPIMKVPVGDLSPIITTYRTSSTKENQRNFRSSESKSLLLPSSTRSLTAATGASAVKMPVSFMKGATSAMTKGLTSTPIHASNTDSDGRKQKLPIVQRRLPQEKVLYQKQGNKIIKKITCFETWHVINIPQVAEAVQKNFFGMSLIQLGNKIKEVKLPSDGWNYKVTLQKPTLQQKQQQKLSSETDEPPEVYTGDLEDDKIPESDRDKYQPINIMFRRQSKSNKTRTPHDRAVTFKNKTFFTNIDGKNVRLIGAPVEVNNIEEIQILLEIMNELTLTDPSVEQMAFVL